MVRPVSLLLVLVLCLSGYFLLSRTHYKYHQLRRSNGYHTFLMSSGAGLLLLFLAIFVYFIGQQIYQLTGYSWSLAKCILYDILQTKASATDVALLDISMVMGCLSLLLPVLRYRGSVDNYYSELLSSYENDPESSEFTELFFRSLEFGLPILFTMSDRKVFIGYITSMNIFDFNDIHIRPILSGYRHKDSLKLILVTPYKDVFDTLKKNNDGFDEDAFTVTLPLREILHAHLYDFEYQKDFELKEQGFTQNNKATIEEPTFDDDFSFDTLNNILKNLN
ncbi:hypothetical protein WOC08_16455 [Vibrio parahaemolyticus]|nr:hypothetical protein [Vibrio parahaemolyticus]HCE2586949.1 hypothetical protein [Vibrio parahaemolyticus]HCE2589521.1 hypothetical protein [Vibrio parahaemolyticus]